MVFLCFIPCLRRRLWRGSRVRLGPSDRDGFWGEVPLTLKAKSQGEIMKEPIRVAVTGAAGNIGYALLFRLASGNCFGDDQPLILQLLEIPPAMGALEGVVMELQDAAFPLIHGIETSDDANVAFKDVDVAFLVGSRPRSKTWTVRISSRSTGRFLRVRVGPSTIMQKRR